MHIIEQGDVVGATLRRYTVYRKTSAEENFRGFRGFLLNCKSFPMNYGLVNQQYESTKLLQQKFYCE